MSVSGTAPFAVELSHWAVVWTKPVSFEIGKPHDGMLYPVHLVDSPQVADGVCAGWHAVCCRECVGGGELCSHSAFRRVWAVGGGAVAPLSEKHYNQNYEKQDCQGCQSLFLAVCHGVCG